MRIAKSVGPDLPQVRQLLLFCLVWLLVSLPRCFCTYVRDGDVWHSRPVFLDLHRYIIVVLVAAFETDDRECVCAPQDPDHFIQVHSYLLAFAPWSRVRGLVGCQI